MNYYKAYYYYRADAFLTIDRYVYMHRCVNIMIIYSSLSNPLWKITVIKLVFYLNSNIVLGTKKERDIPTYPTQRVRCGENRMHKTSPLLKRSF